MHAKFKPECGGIKRRPLLTENETGGKTMTIKEYLAGVPDMKSKDGTSLKDTMADVVSIWSNDACSGYCIDALQHAGYSREQIREVLAELQASFNGISVEEAERLYIEY